MTPTQIMQMLNAKAATRMAQDAERCLVVARPTMDEASLPSGVTLTARPVLGKRKVVKNRRQHANQRLHIAEWPEANLHEIAVPKLAYIISGNADYLLGKYCVHCSEGSIILIPPRFPHQCRGPFLQGKNLQEGSCGLLHAYAYSHGIVLWLSRSQNEKHFNEYADNYLFPNITAVKIFNLLMESAEADKGNFEIVGNGLLTSFFSMLAQEIAEEHFIRTSPTTEYTPLTDTGDSFAEQVHEYLEANCHKPLKLEDAAAQMYMSVSQFTRKLRQETGFTFVELLTVARIERAKQMLRETDWTSTVISDFVGFKSSNYFGELFHRRVGYTPAQYRRLIAQDKRITSDSKIDRIPLSLSE